MTKVLGIFGHCDDEILVAGGTLAKHVSDGDEVHVLIMSPGVGSRDGSRDDIPARVAMCDKASDIIGYDATILDWPDQMFDTRPQLELNRAIESFVEKHKPAWVYTHWDQDNNMDHRLVSKACQVACRSVGFIFMGKPNGVWTHTGFSHDVQQFNGRRHDISEFMDIKGRALECYKDELGEVLFSGTENFIVTAWTSPGAKWHPAYEDKSW